MVSKISHRYYGLKIQTEGCEQYINFILEGNDSSGSGVIWTAETKEKMDDAFIQIQLALKAL